MIITNRAAAPSYCTDAVAQSVRAFIAPASRSVAAGTERGTERMSRGDLARLYPNVFALDASASARNRPGRAAAAALAAAASIAAALLLVLRP